MHEMDGKHSNALLEIDDNHETEKFTLISMKTDVKRRSSPSFDM